jgi:DNA-binding transcriptional LysR family regulator
VRLTGTVRLTAPDDISERLLPERLHALRETYPGIMLEMIVADRFLNLSRRDADVSFRPSRDPGDTLISRRLCAVAVTIYCRRDAFTCATALTDAPVVSGDDSLAHTDSVKWMESQAGDRIVLRANTMAGRLYAVRAGIGIAALPCFSADPNPMLVRVTDPIPEMENELWLLNHPDLRNTARITAFTDFMAASLSSNKDLLEGRRARS